MKLILTLRKIWNLPPPQTWREVYAVILTLLLILLVAATLIDILKGTLP